MFTLSSRPVILVSIASLALVVSSAIGAHAYKTVKRADHVISVTGSAQKRIVSDQARWTVSLQRSGDIGGIKEGNAQMTKDLSILLAYLKKAGYSGTGITVQPVNLMTLNNYNTGPLPTGYQLNQQVIVEGNNVQDIAKIAAGSTALVGQGLLLTTVGIEYVYTHLQELRIEMIAEATKNAKARAVEIAKSADVGLGRLSMLGTGVFQITPINSTDISDYGSYDTTSIEKQITSTVKASFEVR
jgi:hypothetical protein